jgi:hypothetical protein
MFFRMIVSASPIAETIAITVPITINGQAKGGMQLIGGASPEVMVGSVLMHPCNGPLAPPLDPDCRRFCGSLSVHRHMRLHEVAERVFPYTRPGTESTPRIFHAYRATV